MNASWNGTIPIYINNFNWLTWPKELAAYFNDVPGTEIIFVDNASTYPPLLEWYAADCPNKVVRQDQNRGKFAPWTSGAILPPAVHRAYFGSEYYVVTDPDLDLSNCPKDLIHVLISGLLANPVVNKVGLSLEIDDLPEGSLIGKEAQSWERQFWQCRFNESFFSASVDTTFALYSIDTPVNIAQKYSGHPCLRSDRPYTARHLPWYLTVENLTSEHLHFMRASRNGHWMRKLVKHWEENASPDRSTQESEKLYSPTAPWFPSAAEFARFSAQHRISDALVNVLNGLLKHFCPKSILETGPGLSSILFYRYRQKHPDCIYYSIDEQGRFHQSFCNHMLELGFDIGNALACEVEDGFYKLEAYSPALDRIFDLVLFDGPAGSRRRGSLLSRRFLEQHGGTTTTFIIDDTNRGPEAALVEHLRACFGRESFQGYDVFDPMFTNRKTTILVPMARIGVIESAPDLKQLMHPVPSSVECHP